MDPLTAPIRTGIVGFGLAGRVFHAPFVATDPEFALEVIVTSDTDRAHAARTAHPRARVVDDVADLMATDLDLVVIATPPATHAALAGAALDRGCAVVVDKPFTVTEREGLALIEKADDVGRPLTVFHNRRWDGDFLTLRRLLDDGELGSVRRFESRFEVWKPEVTKAWKARSGPAEGGGILYDLGTHLIDQALELFGPIEDLYAEVSTHRRDAAAPDDAFLALHHANGVRSHLWMGDLVAQKGPRFRVLGSDAAYTTWHLDGQEAALSAGARPTDADYGVEPADSWGKLGIDGAALPVPSIRGQYDRFYTFLADALLRGGPVPVDPRDAVAVTKLIERIHADHPG